MTKRYTSDDRQHLAFIQGVINRMGGNSILMRITGVALATIILGVGACFHNQSLIYIAIIQTVLFWGLDAYYLYQERLYRVIYNNVAACEYSVEVRNKDIVYCMKPSLLSVFFLELKNLGYISAIFSKTVAPTYSVLLIEAAWYLHLGI